MKLKNVCVAVVALALAVGMTACGGEEPFSSATAEEAFCFLHCCILFRGCFHQHFCCC